MLRGKRQTCGCNFLGQINTITLFIEEDDWLNTIGSFSADAMLKENGTCMYDIFIL